MVAARNRRSFPNWAPAFAGVQYGGRGDLSLQLSARRVRGPGLLPSQEHGCGEGAPASEEAYSRAGGSPGLQEAAAAARLALASAEPSPRQRFTGRQDLTAEQARVASALEA
ncbi:hypothetical protein GCM10009095_28510 [Sphingomonas molluscorum]|nr:hypothetical protein GCM10017606_19530 [Microbacterium terregens]